MIRSACVLSFLLLMGTGAVRAQSGDTIAVHYKPAADALIKASLEDGDGYANLTYLCDHIGKRISGSEPLERAIAWSAELMKKEGLTNVTVQPVMVPKWVRGHESAAIIAPVAKTLHMLGLGMSVGTAPGGITAEAVVVPDFAALKALGREKVAGKIVVYNAPYEGYGRTVMYRVAGASQAAALGAVGVLVRSITPLAEQTPHTGTLVYDAKVSAAKIPAAVSPEDAMMLARLAAEGKPVTVHLDMEAH